MVKHLDERYASNRKVSSIAVETQLFRILYAGQNMASYIDQFYALFSELDTMEKDAAIPETHKAPKLLASIDSTFELQPTTAALRTKEVKDL